MGDGEVRARGEGDTNLADPPINAMRQLRRNVFVLSCRKIGDTRMHTNLGRGNKPVMGMVVVVQYLINPSCELTNFPPAARKQGNPRLCMSITAMRK
jgi:hypothetical protein